MDQEDKQEYKQNLKILIVGEGGVGKTAIIQKYVNNFYPDMYKQSVGCNFFSKKLDLTETQSVTLSLWDCSSDGLKSRMFSTYIFESDAVLFVYDITNRSSFEIIPDLVKSVQNSLDNQSVQYAILGNKSDLFNQIAVEEGSAQHLSKLLNIPYYSVSAKIGSNLNDCFKSLAYKCSNIPLPLDKSSQNNNNNSNNNNNVPDLSSEVKSKLQANKTSSGCAIF